MAHASLCTTCRVRRIAFYPVDKDHEKVRQPRNFFAPISIRAIFIGYDYSRRDPLALLDNRAKLHAITFRPSETTKTRLGQKTGNFVKTGLAGPVLLEGGPAPVGDPWGARSDSSNGGSQKPLFNVSGI